MSFLGGGALAGGPVGVVIGAIGEIVKFLTGLGGGMKSFVHDVTLSLKLAWGSIAQPIMSTLDLIKGWIVGLLQRLKKIIEILQEKIGRVLGPIIRIVKQMRDFWDNIFKHYIAPILNTIQHIRQTLTIFKVFHLKFATALDAKLASLEGAIASRFLIVKQEMNRLLSWAELIYDPAGFIRGNAIWGGLLQSMAGLGALVRGFSWGNVPTPPTPKTAKQLADDTYAASKSMFARYQTDSLNDDEQAQFAEIRSLFT